MRWSGEAQRGCGGCGIGEMTGDGKEVGHSSEIRLIFGNYFRQSQ
jgi:hypothetical protein